MCRADDRELAVIRSDFCMVVARWRLTQREVAALLGSPAGSQALHRVLPDGLGVEAETRLRMVVRFDRGLSRLIPDETEMAEWLRAAAVEYDGASPLAAIGDLANLRAIVRVLEAGRAAAGPALVAARY